MESSKENFIKNIREWVKIENEMKTLQKELNVRKKEKAKVSGELINLMKQFEVSTFNIQNGQICYCKTSNKKPITQKSLLNILAKFYDGDESQAAQIGQFIFENREIKTKESIKMKPIAASTSNAAST